MGIMKCAVCAVVCGNGVAGIGGNFWCGSGTERTVVSLTALCRRAVRQDTLFVDWSVRKTDLLYVKAVTNVFWFGLTAKHPPASLKMDTFVTFGYQFISLHVECKEAMTKT
jgi:hypothetical protein